MNMTPEMITLGTQLATVAGRKSVEAIFDKMRAVKQTGDKEEIINNLEEIINELISDKNQLIQISQAYEERLITQSMTDVEIEYITGSVIPLLENLLEQSNGDDAEKMQSGLEIIKPILSKEMFNIMQILGFNFKHAIGEPLTDLISALIRSKVPTNIDVAVEAQLIAQQKELEYLKICQDPEAFQRLMQVYGK